MAFARDVPPDVTGKSMTKSQSCTLRIPVRPFFLGFGINFDAAAPAPPPPPPPRVGFPDRAATVPTLPAAGFW